MSAKIVRTLFGAMSLTTLVSSQIASAIVITENEDATALAGALLVPGSNITILSADLSRGDAGSGGGEGPSVPRHK